jgi:DNA adenine methylase
LKWAGGKRWLAPLLQTFWREHPKRRWVEPFCGGLGAALSLRPEQALLNDINPHLINFYQHLQTGLIGAAFGPADNTEAVFYAQRERFNQLIQQGESQTPEAALLFYYLNRTCFNGLCRFNRRGLFNVPFGAYKSIAYLSEAEFSAYPAALAGWCFTCQDFSQMQIQADDFLYVDPPYDVPFTSYAQEDFDWRDQERLVAWLAQHRGPILVSNQATPRIIDLYQGAGFEIRYLNAPRRISANGKRDHVQEIIAFKQLDALPNMTEQPSLFP